MYNTDTLKMIHVLLFMLALFPLDIQCRQKSNGQPNLLPSNDIPANKTCK